MARKVTKRIIIAQFSKKKRPTSLVSKMFEKRVVGLAPDKKISYQSMKLGMYSDTKLHSGYKTCKKPISTNQHLGEIEGPVVHDRAGIVEGAKVVDLVEVVLQKVVAHVVHDVVPQDLHMFIAVGARLLVPKA
jgi:hypothetical protein